MTSNRNLIAKTLKACEAAIKRQFIDKIEENGQLIISTSDRELVNGLLENIDLTVYSFELTEDCLFIKLLFGQKYNDIFSSPTYCVFQFDTGGEEEICLTKNELNADTILFFQLLHDFNSLDEAELARVLLALDQHLVVSILKAN